MIKVSIIGSGNIAQHLIAAFSLVHQIELVQVFARNKNKLSHLLAPNQIVTQYKNLTKADLFIIAVSDDAISSVSEQIPFENVLVIHTSGSLPMQEIACKNRKGVLYPLQTFSKNKTVDFSLVPICIESENESDYLIIEKVAKSISNVVYSIDSEQRKSLHVSAVFVNNFVNHLYQIGYEICLENKISFDILKPLIQETANKMETLLPSDAQTGPAKRKDIQTITSHLDFLQNENQKAIYKLLTQSIQNHE